MDNLQFIVLLVLIFIFHSHLTVINSQCWSCNNPQCSGTNCLECKPVCPDTHYEVKSSSDFVCQITPPTPAMPETTTSTTQVTAMPETTTQVTLQTIINAITNQSAHEMAQNTTSQRRRRQVNGTDTTVGDTLPTPTTESTTTTAAPTIASTTPAARKVLCKQCLDTCKTCKDDAMNNTVCASCSDGYDFSSDFKSCDKSDKLSGGAIAGIVIGVLCFLAIVAGTVIFLVRRYKIGGGGEMGPGTSRDNNGHRNFNISSPLPKISTEDMQRQHDRITRYAKDPTIKKISDPSKNDESSNIESNEIRNLGPAPLPPEVKIQSYDRLSATNSEVPHSYTELTEKPPESDYVNIQTTAPTHQKQYQNTRQANPPRVFPPSSRLGQHSTADAEQQETYEPVNTDRFDKGPQEFYVNSEHVHEIRNNDTDNEENQEIYVNGEIIEETYENA